MSLRSIAWRRRIKAIGALAPLLVFVGCGPNPGGGGGGGASPTPNVGPTNSPNPGATPYGPGPMPLIGSVPGMPGNGPLVQPAVTPAPGGGPTSYPQGTVFATGNVRVTLGPGGKFTPEHIYLRPGTTTTIVNTDSVAHNFAGFNGATDSSGPIQPGGSYTKSWAHPGTWTFHDTMTPNSYALTVTDVPETAE